MKIIPTILFSLLTAGLGFLVVMQQTRGNLDFIFGSPPIPIGDVVYKFDPAEVGRIIIKSDGTRAEIVKSGGTWMLNDPWNDFADPRIVRSLIYFAARLQIEDVIERDDVDDLADFGLKSSRIEVEIFDKSESPLCKFNMGRYTSWRGFDPTFKSEDPTKPPPSFPTLIIQPVEEDKKDHLYVCSDFPDPRLRIDPMGELFIGKLRLFRDQRVFSKSLDIAAEITLKEKNSASITVKRKGISKEDEWEITKPFELATSPGALQILLKGLAQIEANAVLDESLLALPPPLPDNIDHTISVRYFQPDGSMSPPVTAVFYPPVNDEAINVPVVVTTESGKNRSAILMVPNGPESILASIPRDVTSLRSRTMTALQVRQIEGVTLSDFTGRKVDLTLEKDPHERALRWYSQVTRDDGSNRRTELYNGAANIYQVKELFEALFRDEVNSFTNDASTDPAEYGLDQPIRRVSLKLKDDKTVFYVIGEKLRPQYFSRRADNGRPLEISEEAYEAALEGKPHRELEIVAGPGNLLTSPPTGLELLGLAQPKIAKVNGITIHLGKINSRHFFANRLDEQGNNTPHVVEIGPQNVDRMPLDAFHWRGIRLWNINRYEINGLIIKRQNEEPLELDYDFFAPTQWSATRAGKDVTALLNTNKAEKLLKKLTDVEVKKWLGPVVENAAERLAAPGLMISVLIEEVDDEGRSKGRVIRQLKLSEIVEGEINRLCFGKSDTSPSYFLVDAATYQRLIVNLLEE